MAAPFNSPLPSVGEKPWTLNPAIIEMRGRQGTVEDTINTGRLSPSGLSSEIAEAAASVEVNDETVATLVAGETETNAALVSQIEDSESAVGSALTAKIVEIAASPEGEAEAAFGRTFVPPRASDIPVVTVSTSSSFSSGSTTRPAAKSGDATAVDMAGDTHFSYDGSPSMSLASGFAQVPYVPAGPSTAGSSGSFVARAHFLTPYTDKVEISFKPPQSAGNRYRLLIDGKPVTFESQALGTLTTAAEHFMLLTFPTARVRRITWENPSRNLFGGVRLASGAPVRPITSGLRLAIIGDSFTDGAGTPADGATRLETWAAQAARMLGAAEFALFGIGGTGYLATAPGHGAVAGKGPYSGRLASVVEYAPDVVIVLGSINDLAYTSGYSTELQTAVQDVVQGLSTVPRVIVVGLPMPPYVKGGVPTDYGLVNEAVRAGAMLGGAEFVDPLVDTVNDPWITPADLGTDNVHPKLTGHSKIAKRVFAEIGPLSIAASAAAPVAGDPTTTSLTSSNSSPAVGDAVTLTATVTPSAATGSVQFKDGATVLGTVAVAGGSAVLTGAVLATAGARTLTAVFQPDTLDYQSSTGVVGIQVLTAYSLGVNDYAHRYLAAKISGAVGDQIATWPDELGSQPLVKKASDDTQFTIGEESGERKVIVTGDGTGGALYDPTAIGEPFTVVVLSKIPVSGRAAVRKDGFAFGRAANGTFSLTGTGNVTTPGNSNWNVAAFVGNGASSKLRVGPTTVGPGTITGRASVSTSNPDGLDAPASQFVASGVQNEIVEIIVYPRELTSGELDTVFAAMAAHSALI
jgi:lysophospholipase L1-like esterase